ncbi:MAG: hypothetical protein MRY57_01940 [Candidatus Pacebacteria bacterium]|nr:hypothetical protein [Candidatus Paceibacterota bacterium]
MNLKIKSWFLLSLCSFFVSGLSYSQIVDDSFNLASEFNRVIQIPNSPEAEAFQQYGKVPVDLFSGKPEISIPLYAHKGREMELPISLSYAATGIKVEQLASQVGLGWNLNIGGRITRVVNGYPDDYFLGADGTSRPYETFWNPSVNNQINAYLDIGAPRFQTKDSLIDYLNFLRDYNRNKIDTQPDYFTINALGYSDTFVIDRNSKEGKSLSNPLVKITYIGGGSPSNPIIQWEVVLDNGMRLIFDEYETTFSRNITDTHENLFGYKKKYISSWVLTKVISPTEKDTYTFSYEQPASPWDPVPTANQYAYVTNPLENPTVHQGWISPTNYMYSGEAEYSIHPQVLTHVYYHRKDSDAQLLYYFEQQARCDISQSKRISKIAIYYTLTPNASSLKLYKRYDLNYSYFTNGEITNPCDPQQALNVRLKLDGIDVLDKERNIEQNYYFVYHNPTNIKSLTSKSQDEYGYPNNSNNTVMFPTHPHRYITDGGNRRSNLKSGLTGTLTKIYYPTGGYTEFEYESHKEAVLDQYEIQYTNLNNIDNYLADESELDLVNSTICGYHATLGQRVKPKYTPYLFEVDKTKPYKFITQIVGSGSSGYLGSLEPFGLVRLKEPLNTVLPWESLFDSDCSFSENVDAFWNLPRDGGRKYIELEAGYYIAYIANIDIQTTKSIQISESISVPVYKQMPRPGIRIKSVTNYTKDQERVSKRLYTYDEGQIISKPIYSYISKEFTFNAGDNRVETSDILHRYSVTNGTQWPHIGYGLVEETQLDNNDNAIVGTVRHRFNIESYGNFKRGVFSTRINGQNTPNYYGVNYALGKSKQVLTIDANENVKQDTKQEYQQANFFLQGGIFTTKRVDLQSALFPIAKQNQQGQWFIDYISPQLFGGFASPSLGIGTPSGIRFGPPPECSVYGGYASDLCTPGIGRLVKQTTKATGSKGFLRQKVNITHENSVTNTQTIYYDYYLEEPFRKTSSPLGETLSDTPINNEPTYQLKRKTILNDEDQYEYVEYFYPSQYDGTQEYEELRQANILNPIIESKSYIEPNGNDNIGPSTALKYNKNHVKTKYNGVYPQNLKEAKGNLDWNSLELKHVFTRYEKGNLVEYKKPHGEYTTYLWGYNYRYLIAKIEGARFHDVMTSLIGVSYGDLQTKVNGELRAIFQALRSTFPEALITTYLHTPDIGISEITQPNQTTLYYDYDDFHRLEAIRDQDGHFIERYSYNVRPTSPPHEDPPPPDLRVNGVSVVVDNSTSPGSVEYSGYLVGLEGGTSPYQYQWTCTIEGGATIDLGTNETFVYTYQINAGNSPCVGFDINDPNTFKSLTFKCVISDNGTPIQTIESTHQEIATCYTDHQ